MKRITKALVCFWLILSFAISANAAGAVPKKVINATESVVRILSKYSDGYGTGTGFIIKSDKNGTLIITNHHVVADNPYSISVWVGEDDLINAEILATTSQKDICILRLTQQISLKPVTLSETSAKQGDAVYAVGFPAAADILSDTEAHTSQDATITDGIVSARREVTTSQYGTPVEILQISAAINSGNSGGPLFDTNGHVIGVNTYGIADAQGIFGAIDISEIHTFLDENEISLKSDSQISILISGVLCISILTVIFAVIMGKKRKVHKIEPKSFIQEEDIRQPKAAPHKSRGLSKKVTAVLALSTIVFILVAGYFGSYFAINFLVKAGNYSAAEKLLQLPAMTQLNDEQLPTYINAGIMMNNRKYVEAKELYMSIPGFLDADTMVFEAEYCYAAQLADTNDFDTAFHIFQLLAKDDFKDSREKVKEVGYRRGLYIMYEEQDYLTAYNYLKSSLYDEINDIADVRNELKELLYAEGILLYRSGKFEEASKRFIDGYKDSDNYELLITASDPYFGTYRHELQETLKKLIENFYFENAAEIIFNNDNLAWEFLLGNWKSTTGDKYFRADSKYHSISYNLPSFNYGDFYWIFENGQMVIYSSRDDYQTPKTVFSFIALTPNQIQVYCHKDGSTYVLNRQ